MAGLTKVKLNKVLHDPLLKMGYLEFFQKGWTLYGKYLGNGWYLQLNLTISSLYYDQFTVDIYLSKHTWQNDLIFGAPYICFKRLENYLTPYHTEWWHGLEKDSVCDFLKLFKEVEPKVIASIHEIAPEVENNARVISLANINKNVFDEYCCMFGSPSPTFSEINLKKTIRTPETWFIAAKKYFDEFGPFANWAAGSYEMHAQFAYREWVMREYALRNH